MERVAFAAATYNIHRCIGRDRRRDAARLISVLRDLDVAVIALQEVETLVGRGPEHDQFVYLANSLGMHAVAGPAMFRSDSTYGNAVLSAFPVHAVRRHEMSVPGREPRGAVEVELMIQERLVRVITTHLGLSGTERWRQCQSLERVLDMASLPTLLLGDFNEWLPSSRGLRLLRRHARDHSRRTFPAFAPLLALDRMFVRGGLRVDAVRAVSAGAAARASDHLPLRAELSL